MTQPPALTYHWEITGTFSAFTKTLSPDTVLPNPCAAKIVYQDIFRLKKIPLKWVTHLVADAQVIPIIQLSVFHE